VPPAFAVWITGRPAAGKSTLAAALRRELRDRGADPVVLESDVLRRVLTPQPRYTEAERDAFYGALAGIGRLLVDQGHPVIFDATAHRRAYREAARREIANFLEVHVDVPLMVCRARDPKGIYRDARNVPGVDVPYEPPERPDVVVGLEEPAPAARRIADLLGRMGWLSARGD